MADGIGDGVSRNYVGMYQVLGKFQRPRFPRICEENLAGKEIKSTCLNFPRSIWIAGYFSIYTAENHSSKMSDASF